jgi:hypothetical protein
MGNPIRVRSTGSKTEEAEMKVTRGLVALAGGLMLIVTGIAPASGEAVSFEDERGDVGHSADIRQVTVNYADSQLKVLIGVRNVARAAGVQVYVDSRPQRRGPEFVLLGPISLGDYDWRVARVHRAWRYTGQELLCGSDLSSRRRGDVVRVAFELDCLRNPDTLNLRTGEVTQRSPWPAPDQVRVAVRTSKMSGGGDWSPSPEDFHPQVSRG